MPCATVLVAKWKTRSAIRTGTIRIIGAPPKTSPFSDFPLDGIEQPVHLRPGQDADRAGAVAAVQQQARGRGFVRGIVGPGGVDKVLLFLAHDVCRARFVVRVVTGIEMDDLDLAGAVAHRASGGGQLAEIVIDMPIRPRTRRVGCARADRPAWSGRPHARPSPADCRRADRSPRPVRDPARPPAPDGRWRQNDVEHRAPDPTDSARQLAPPSLGVFGVTSTQLSSARTVAANPWPGVG